MGVLNEDAQKQEDVHMYQVYTVVIMGMINDDTHTEMTSP